MFNVIESKGAVIKAWNDGVPFEPGAIAQTQKVAELPFVKGVALMPDCHIGVGCTIGTVIASEGAISPAVVGVDIGCGMYAVRTRLTKKDVLPELNNFYRLLSTKIPNGRTNNGGEGDRGAWGNIPERVHESWIANFSDMHMEQVYGRHPEARTKNGEKQLGTLGTGNHFIEISVDLDDDVWVVLHSGSRGFGNRIGSYFTQLAKKKCEQWFVQLPHPDLAYLPIGTPEFDDYMKALHVAQDYASENRQLMMNSALGALGTWVAVDGSAKPQFVHCHHNYLSTERHFGKNLLITRKGAVRADVDDLAIIPGSMGARTFIAKGLGNRDSYHSCSHGAGRVMGRNEAMRKITVEQHVQATEGIVCYKGAEVIDESPSAYKPIEAVMAAQADLVTPIVELRQLVCVKGLS
jgi:tRNA-splicing ligase RtcB (3'-phosphate/5'-hydroxy nucleic acid ligase)